MLQISRSVGRLRMFNILRVTTPGFGSLSSLSTNLIDLLRNPLNLDEAAQISLLFSL